MAKRLAIRDRILRLDRIRAGDLKPHPGNWRRHPEAQREALKGVLQEIGYADALLARETPAGLQLLDGHLRAELDPNQVVPVLVLDVDEAEARKLLATLDPLAAMAQPDMDKLLPLLASIETESQAVKDMLEALANGETLPLPPMTEAEMAVLDSLDTIQGQWKVELGQVWEVPSVSVAGKAHRIICQDSHTVQREPADVLLTDPPYGIGIVRGQKGSVVGREGSSRPHVPRFGRVRQAGGRVGTIGGKGAVQPHVYPIIAGDNEPFDPTPWLNAAPTIILFGANHYASRLPDSAGWIVWDKGISPEASFSEAELLWTNQPSHVKLYSHRWSGMVRAGDRKTELALRLHPTQKPVGLLAQILGDFSRPGDIVLDPYLGSGSLAIACEKTGRICYGMEIEPQYVAVTLERMQKMGLEPRLIEHPKDEHAV